MKKLFVAMLVLGIVSITNAGLDLLKLAPNQAAVTLNLASCINFYITLEQGNTYSIELTDNAGGFSIIREPEEYGDGFDWCYMTIASSSDKSILAGQQMIITLLEGQSMDIQLHDASGYVVLTDVMTLVPEPMTLGLLGVGALFMRRRK